MYHLRRQALQGDDVVLHRAEQLLETHGLGGDAPPDLLAFPLLVQGVVVRQGRPQLLDGFVAPRQLQLEQLDLVRSEHQGAVEFGVDGGHAAAHQQLRLRAERLVVFERLLRAFEHEQALLVLHHDEGVKRGGCGGRHTLGIVRGHPQCLRPCAFERVRRRRGGGAPGRGLPLLHHRRRLGVRQQLAFGDVASVGFVVGGHAYARWA